LGPGVGTAEPGWGSGRVLLRRGAPGPAGGGCEGMYAVNRMVNKRGVGKRGKKRSGAPEWGPRAGQAGSEGGASGVGGRPEWGANEA